MTRSRAMNQSHRIRARKWALLVACLGMLFFTSPAVTLAASSTEIDIGVSETLKQFKAEVPGGSEFLQRAAGVLVFPKVIKAGFGLGGEYGEGALLIDGEVADYYSTAAASIGLQLGAQSKSLLVVFLAEDSLKYFRNSKGWKAGVDGSIAVVEWGAGEDINTLDI